MNGLLITVSLFIYLWWCFIHIDGSDIMIVYVKEAPESMKPVYFNGKRENTFIRTGEGDRRATKSVSKIREEIGLSDYKVRKWLEILDEKKLVQRVGSGPATKYAVRETADEKITQLQIALDNLKTKE